MLLQFRKFLPCASGLGLNPSEHILHRQSSWFLELAFSSSFFLGYEGFFALVSKNILKTLSLGKHFRKNLTETLSEE